MSQRVLGKGLSQLLGEQAMGNVEELPLDAIVPNRSQPRTTFDETAIEELAHSIGTVGVLQPVLVRPVAAGKYELIAGERRWRAAQRAGLKTLPAMVRGADPKDALLLAVVENVQREDISAIEAARAYRRLMDEFGLTQEQVAGRVGKSRSAVANTARLLQLPEAVLRSVEEGRLSEGHARTLLRLPTDAARLAALKLTQAKDLSVRELERYVDERTPSKRKRVDAPESRTTSALERAFSEKLGLPVRISGSGRGGLVTIRFFSDDDLAKVADELGVRLE